MVDDAAFLSFAKNSEIFVAGFFSDVDTEVRSYPFLMILHMSGWGFFYFY